MASLSNCFDPIFVNNLESVRKTTERLKMRKKSNFSLALGWLARIWMKVCSSTMTDELPWIQQTFPLKSRAVGESPRKALACLATPYEYSLPCHIFSLLQENAANFFLPENKDFQSQKAKLVLWLSVWHETRELLKRVKSLAINQFFVCETLLLLPVRKTFSR